MTHSHSVICREKQRIGKRALVIHLATNRYLSQHRDIFYQQCLKRTFGTIRGATASKQNNLPFLLLMWQSGKRGVIGVKMEM